MGMFRETDGQEIDIIKEMAEGLGSQGIRLDETLEKIQDARSRIEDAMNGWRHDSDSITHPDAVRINRIIREHNALVDKAHDTLHWLLIQREACGFRVHKNVEFFYPIPQKIRLFSEGISDTETRSAQ